jgi:hypothetical protein
MAIPAKYKVDFGGYANDFRALARARLLDQFKNAPVLTQVLDAFVDEVQEVYDAVCAAIEHRSLYRAGGEQLAALGRIVGQNPDIIQAGAAIPYLIFDAAGNGWDQTDWWVPGAATTGTRPPNDDEYAVQVLGRIHNNCNRFSSIPELQAAILDIFGINVSFTSQASSVDYFTWDVIGNGWEQGHWWAAPPLTSATLYVVVPSTTSMAARGLIVQFVEDLRVDKRPFIAWPVTFVPAHWSGSQPPGNLLYL